MGNRDNNFGSLRLVFAALVIASHTPEMLDGNVSRELLSMVFGTLSFGGLAVDGFFVMSGYLITKSMVQGGSLLAFTVSRVARIVPGFMVAFWLCVLVLAPFVTTEAVYSSGVLFNNAVRALMLGSPDVPGVFSGNHYASLNGSLWTIGWEFLCYIGIGILGFFGFLRPRYRYLILCGVLVLLTANAFLAVYPIPWLRTAQAIRLSAVFGAGSLFFLFRDKVRFTNRGAVIAGGGLFVLMFVPALAEAAVATLGGYLLFWFAFHVPQVGLSRLRHDISYGVYLYGWPAGALLVWLNPAGNPWIIGFATLAIAIVCALISWVAIEGPTQDLAKAWLADRRARQALHAAA